MDKATRWKIAAAFAVLVSTTGCAAISGQETTGEYVDDATISTKVRAALVKDQALKAFPIHVETMQNTVQLSGFVDSVELKNRAEQVALSVEGARQVKNDIVVR
jgi:hyperosmotically inducible protein